MHTLSSRDPAWYRALTLTERVASLRLAPGAGASAGIAGEIARRRLDRWRAQVPFPAGPYFGQRLAADDVAEGELLRVLAEPVESIRDRLPAAPGWLNGLE